MLTIFSCEEFLPNSLAITFIKKIYKSKQGFYLYLLMNNSETNFVIYYKQDQHSELTIFLQQLLKQYNNDKATNK